MIYSLPQKSEKKDFIFNMIGSLANAAVSVVLLVIVSHVVGASAAGVFSVAYSTAQMIYTICVFEMRNIQVTDAKREFSFSDIATFRIVTTVAAILFYLVFAFLRGYNGERFYITGILVIYMSLMSVSDLFQGNMHLNGFLSLAGISLTCGSSLAAVAFAIALVFTKNLFMSILPMIAVLILWLILYDIPISNLFSKAKIKLNFAQQKRILMCSVPLFLSTFMHQYIFNSPKYAIENVLSKQEQAHYGYLVMPVFCINLLSIFVFRPQLITLSRNWAEKKFKEYKQMVTKLYFWVMAVTVAALIGGYILGVPILEFLYGADLSGKRPMFMILMLAGGFGAASTLTMTLFTTMHMQKLCLIAYVFTMIFSLIAPDIFVKHYGLMGAAVVYLCEMIMLFFIMFIVFLMVLGGKKQND